MKTLLASLPDVKKLDVDFVDKKGYRVNASMFKNYEYVYDSFTLEVKLKAELTSGEISSFPIPNLDDYVKKIKRFSGGKKDGT
ncbi:hypothetical protein KGP36_06540 [Patescibacteria group bacterium]|nr:hypothetical protein [Patescibacteria group bacterium]